MSLVRLSLSLIDFECFKAKAARLPFLADTNTRTSSGKVSGIQNPGNSGYPLSFVKVSMSLTTMMIFLERLFPSSSLFLWSALLQTSIQYGKNLRSFSSLVSTF